MDGSGHPLPSRPFLVSSLTRFIHNIRRPSLMEIITSSKVHRAPQIVDYFARVSGIGFENNIRTRTPRFALWRINVTRSYATKSIYPLDFARAVNDGLLKSPKSVPAQYLYDEVGSA